MASRAFEFDEVKGEADGESAWNTFAVEPFDFVVLDLLLPKLDGLALARRMLEAVPEIRILALSNAMKKLGISDEASLLRFALDKGLLKNKGGLNWTVEGHRQF